MLQVHGAEGIKALVGEHLGWSDYEVVTQEQVNLFADATGDHQWIHVDPERAAKESPFGGPDRPRLPHPVPRARTSCRRCGRRPGSPWRQLRLREGAVPVTGAGRLEVRCGVTVDAVDEIAGGLSVTLTAVIECEGAPKPTCVAQVVYRYYE